MAIELEPEELEKELNELQRKLERLRVLYEQYFLGIERTPPYNLRREVVGIVHRLAQVRTRQAGLKFRLQSLIQKFNAHKSYWARTTREIESGTYARHKFRLKKREAEAGTADAGLTTQDFVAINQIRTSQGDDAADRALDERRAARTEAGDLADQFMRELAGDREAAPAPRFEVTDTPAPRTPPRTETESPSVGGPRGISEEDLRARADKLRALRSRFQKNDGTAAPPDEDRQARAVYDRLLAAKKRLNEPTDKLSFDAVKASLQKQTERTREKHGCREVGFDVVEKDGRAFLKPIPK